ncbi:MAG: HNH endonuclease [Desulfobacterales bacterium]|nr:HNH endonuclease [Desulfobacterales bacterium]
MNRYIGKELRRLVAKRSNYLCEYCLISEDDTHLGCEVDHIISLKHGGTNEQSNLAYACFFCNRYKGSDIGSVLSQSDRFVRFYNPRKDRWTDHFRLEGNLIMPLSEIGEVTVRILGFNSDDRIVEREYLISADRYPSSYALEYLNR